MNYRIIMALTMVVCIATPASAENEVASISPPPPGRVQRTWDDYRVVVDLNIFSRDRRRPPADLGFEQSGTPTAPAPQEAAYHVLVGLSIVGDRATAVFEDRRDGTANALHVGDQLAGRTITRITLDDARVSSETGEIAVRPGMSLLGQAPLIPADEDDPAIHENESSSPDDFADEIDYEAIEMDAPVNRAIQPPGPSPDDIIQRMRDRRQRELEQ